MKNLNLVHLNGLKALESVGRLGSLALAADELGVTSGAVSQQIIKVEAQLGRRLFDREPKGLVPTELGRAVLAQLTEGFELLSRAVANAQMRDECVLTVSVAPVLATYWLVPRLKFFTERYPDIRLRIEATMAPLAGDSGDIDLGIHVGTPPFATAKAELLKQKELFVVCVPDIARRLNSPADIFNVPVLCDSSSSYPWRLWLDAAGLEGEVVPHHVFNETSICLGAAVAGQGVMLAWPTIAGHAIANGQLVVPLPIRVRPRIGYYFLTPPGRKLRPQALAFKAWVADEMAAFLNDIGELAR
ncbi:LysR substrate-binding domain-containing protein [Oryzibacter oryziterrae]|uniref:LysR substrate-binding domain-containing protein n=1 Tax=Oryzibacter oryziterrae TaxID=2766474 RepID=UPI001F196074|nr:LysR substrate-binding domain-containing protein [Oryzibacter oryziterrae]